MRVNTTNPIVTTMPVDVARANPLARGQLLEVLVVQKLGDSRFMLQSGTQRWQTESPLNLQPGERIQARVLQVEPDEPVQLAILRSTQQAAAAVVREQIPRQQSLANLATVLRQTADFSLPPRISDAVLNLIAALPDPSRLAQPAMLSRLLQDSGLFMENRLRNGQGISRDDLKARLLQLAALLPEPQRGDDIGDMPATSPKASPAPYSRQGLATQAMTAGELARQGAQPLLSLDPAARQLLQEVRQLIGQTLATRPPAILPGTPVPPEQARLQLQTLLQQLDDMLTQPQPRDMQALASRLVLSGQPAAQLAQELVSRTTRSDDDANTGIAQDEDSGLVKQLLNQLRAPSGQPAVSAPSAQQTQRLREQLATQPAATARPAAETSAATVPTAAEADPVERLLAPLLPAGTRQAATPEAQWLRQLQQLVVAQEARLSASPLAPASTIHQLRQLDQALQILQDKPLPPALQPLMTALVRSVPEPVALMRQPAWSSLLGLPEPAGGPSVDRGQQALSDTLLARLTQLAGSRMPPEAHATPAEWLKGLQQHLQPEAGLPRDELARRELLQKPLEQALGQILAKPLPPDIRQLVTQLMIALPDPAQLRQAAGWRPLLQVSDTPVTTLSAETLEQADSLLGKLQQLQEKPATPANHATYSRTAEAMAQRAGSHGMLGSIEPQSRLFSHTLAQDAQDWMQQLSNAVDSSLSRLTGHQVQHVQDREAGIQQWMIELPVRDRDGVDVLQLHIRREQRRQQGSDRADPLWQLTLSFDFAATGPMVVRLIQQGEALTIRFHAEQQHAWQWIDTRLKAFGNTLTSRGLPGVQLDLQRGLPHPDTLPMKASPLMRTQA